MREPPKEEQGMSKQAVPVGTASSEVVAAAPQPAAVQRRSYEMISFAKAPDKPPTSGLLIAGFTILVIFFGGFGSWAALAPLASAAIAPGRLVVESNRRTIQHLEGGIIDEILIEENDVVRSGEVLLRLSPLRSENNAEAIQEELWTARIREARLLAQLEGHDSLSLPEELEALRGDNKLTGVIKEQENLLATQSQSVTQQLDVQDQRIEGFQSRISGLNQQVTGFNRQLTSLNAQLAEFQQLLADELITNERVRNLENQITQIESQRAVSLATIAEVREVISSAQSERNLILSRASDQASRELEQLRSQLISLRSNLDNAQDVLERTEILSPVSGKIVNMQFFTVGGVIQPGQTVMEIVPADDRLIAEARVNPNDREVVHENMEADVRLSSLPFRTTPPITAKVTEISADLIEDPLTRQYYYRAEIELNEEEISQYDLFPGMPVEAMIKLNERTFLDYLITPILESLTGAFNDQ